METGYKAFRADVLKTIPLRSNRFGIEPEITAKIAKRHCSIFEVPVRYNGRSYGEGKKITWRDGLAAIYTIAKFWLLDDCYYKNQIAETYNDIERTHHAQESLILRLTPFFGDRLLEIGSGIGSISRILPIREKITLSDHRPEYLELLEKGFRGKTRTDIQELDIQSARLDKKLHNQFDSVIFLHQLQFCQNQELALKNVFNLLQPRGRLIISVPGGEDCNEYEQGLGYLRRYSRESLKTLLNENGFQVLHLFTTNLPALMIRKHVIQKKQLKSLPIEWAKISDSLVKRSGFIEKYFKLQGLTLTMVAEKT
jgi:SAM-dependent methyltransferase